MTTAITSRLIKFCNIRQFDKSHFTICTKYIYRINYFN